jgi:hypothetical protein
MAYTPAADYERQAMLLFGQNAEKIKSWKAMHGGDLEHAYQAVTGQPWPEGRSVKIGGKGPEMTKDRTVKSVLGKYVAPIAAGALTAGFALPALAGVGAASAASSAGAVGAAGAGAGAGAVGAGGVFGSSWLTPLLTTGIGAGTNLLGGKMQNTANREAAELNDKYLRDALEVEKEKEAYDRAQAVEQRDYGRRIEEGRFAGRESRMAPYVQAGGNSADRQAQLLGLPARPSPTQPIPVSRETPAGGVPGGMPANGAVRPAVQPIRAQEQVMLGGAQAQPEGAEVAPEPMVNMMAPDGSTRPVPASQVEHWMAKGAKQV